jgi:hypothetical protein
MKATWPGDFDPTAFATEFGGSHMPGPEEGAVRV